MVQVLPINYNNEHYKPVNFMNGVDHSNYQQHPAPPPLMQQHQQMPIPMPPVPLINHMMPHHPPGYFHPPPPPHHPHQPMYDQGQPFIDYANGGYPAVGFMYQGK